MEQLLTPLDALFDTGDGDQVPRPTFDGAALGDPMLDRVRQMSTELSEVEAYDAQILAGLVSP